MLYTGFHAIEERLRKAARDKSGGNGLVLYHADAGPRAKKIISYARSIGVRCESADGPFLASLVRPLDAALRDHRGLVLEAAHDADTAAPDLASWLALCPPRATVVALDGVTDPRNVGAVIRSCDQLGADLLILPKSNSAPAAESAAAARASAGSSAWVPALRVANIVRAIGLLKDAGFWVYDADMEGVPVNTVEFAQRSCIVLGSEGSGVGRLVKKACDMAVSIPASGKIDSLNVSVAAGILLYERRRQSLLLS